MKIKTKKQKLVAKPHLLLLVFLFARKRVKIYFNRKGTKFPTLNNG